MSYSNISAVLPQADVNAIKAAIATIDSKLPFLVALSNEEKRALFKMGPKSVDFVQESLRIAQNNADILPPSFNAAEFTKDVSLVVPLSEIALLFAQLSEKINDTSQAAGSEAMRGALAVYDYAKTASKHKPGLKSVVEELGRRFKENGGARKPKVLAEP